LPEASITTDYYKAREVPARLNLFNAAFAAAEFTRMQSDHQSGRQSGPANALSIKRTELLIEDLPVDGCGQQIKRL